MSTVNPKPILIYITMKFFMLLLATAGLTFAADNKDCVVSGKANTREVAYSKTVGFCCDKCKAKFDADPKAFADKVAEYKADSGKCLMNGKPADKAQSSEFKATIGVCCDKCKTKVEADPDKYVAKLKK
jgi:YHS domain-containing protein